MIHTTENRNRKVKWFCKFGKVKCNRTKLNEIRFIDFYENHGEGLGHYVNILKEVRDTTIAEFKKSDDTWLMTVDETWPWGPTNNYCKWFHVCEHESNHNGQMKWIKSRIPGLKTGND